ncbi:MULTISPECIES: lipopolysaccharide assembly protein LapA domain-containing protein [unclassified Cysteiniphilum]|nr:MULTISPECIES: lipopolysaccharide assembly protein LapA domain-containing protein [unclassified Cysteiniphilum]WHN65357.1 lipopolysaccharide assembly protein LapA domain-containing protein [Cysteiniphilum sp. QT6929]
MRLLGYIILVIIFVLVAALAVLNAQEVTFNYLIGTFHLPLILLLLVVFVLGLVIGMVLMLLSRKRKLRDKAIKE